MIYIYFTVSLIYYYTALGIARDTDKNVDGAEDEGGDGDGEETNSGREGANDYNVELLNNEDSDGGNYKGPHNLSMPAVLADVYLAKIICKYPPYYHRYSECSPIYRL